MMINLFCIWKKCAIEIGSFRPSGKKNVNSLSVTIKKKPFQWHSIISTIPVSPRPPPHQKKSFWFEVDCRLCSNKQHMLLLISRRTLLLSPTNLLRQPDDCVRQQPKSERADKAHCCCCHSHRHVHRHRHCHHHCYQQYCCRRNRLFHCHLHQKINIFIIDVIVMVQACL